MQMSESNKKISKSNAKDILNNKKSCQFKNNFINIIKFFENDLNNVDQTLLFNDINNNDNNNKKARNNNNYKNKTASNINKKKNYIIC